MVEVSEIIYTVVTGVFGVITTLFVWFVQRRFNAMDKKHERERDEEIKRQQKNFEAQRKENLLVLRQLNSIGKLTYANSIAIKDGKVNGVMHDAMGTYEESQKALSDFLREQAVYNIQSGR